MHDWLLETWYGGGTRGRWLQPLAWLFAGASALRRLCYRSGLLPRFRSSRPVVVVGNLTVGGTGKTPFVLWLAAALAARGLRVGVASRGYRGAGGAARLVEGHEDATITGDEALLLRRRLRMPVAIGARRADAVRLLEPHCELVVADDGLQHYALHRDLEIAVVDGLRGLGNGRMLPAGPLREPRARLDRVDAVVVNGAGFAWPGALSMKLVPVAAVSLADGSRRPLADFSGRKVHALAAIGNPGRFFAMLREHGLAVEEHPFPDHSAIAAGSLPGNRTGPLLMTEKDAVKWRGDRRDAWQVEVVAEVDGPLASALLDRIVQLMPLHGGGVADDR